MATRPRRIRDRRRRRIDLAVVLVVVGLFAGIATFGWWVFAGAAPRLDGSLAVAGLEQPVEIQRDAAGIVTATAATRVDLARATGFIHGQERFFQMDLLRRSGAGELSELVGEAALPLDRPNRLHRFRARAQVLAAKLDEPTRSLLEAYTAGVNAGLTALGRKPFEYTLLREDPAPWRVEDTLLVVYAMYFDLQESGPWDQRRLALARRTLGPALADFLYPLGNPADVALDGSILPEPPMPDAAALPAGSVPVAAPGMQKGSNAFAVSGALTKTGAAMVANDMHLGLSVPNIWFRMRLRLTGASPLDLNGVTLPGTPLMVTGSNGHVAWGFTDAYMTTGDAILLDPVEGDPLGYKTPSGPQTISVAVEHLCPAHGTCQDLPVEETIWGPVVARAADGTRIVWRWCAHDSNAVDFDGPLALETATTIREALDAAHRAGLPQENFVVGDQAGHVAWTIIGRVPQRVGLDDPVPQSWADGSRGWQGYLPANEIPEIIDPPDGRIWTANNRIVGGEALKKLGGDDYAAPGRAREIHDDLFAADHFAEADLLAIQLDARAPMLAPWQALLARLLAARSADPRFGRLIPYVADWGAAALPDSVGYRLVRSFEEDAIRLIYGGFGAPIQREAGGDSGPLATHQAARPSLRLLTEQPANLVPPSYKSWSEVTDALLDRLAMAVEQETKGDPAKFTWGVRNHLGIHHPLARAVPLLGRLTDPPDEPVAGDSLEPRVVVPGDGASERWVVSPGHEADGIMEMPTGNGANPVEPYYLAGHQDWVQGRPSPFLPGPPKWTLTLRPS
jgi:penicillin amidase